MSTEPDAPPDSGEEDPPAASRSERRSFALVLIVVLGAWKIYEAIVAATVRETVAPSLYVLGLGGFAVSILGPRSAQLFTFFAAAILCLVAIAFETR